MKRRLGVIVLFTALLSAAAPVAQATANTTASQWGCAGVRLIDRVVCVSNPLPERLPLPD